MPAMVAAPPAAAVPAPALPRRRPLSRQACTALAAPPTRATAPLLLRRLPALVLRPQAAPASSLPTRCRRDEGCSRGSWVQGHGRCSAAASTCCWPATHLPPTASPPLLLLPSAERLGRCQLQLACLLAGRALWRGGGQRRVRRPERERRHAGGAPCARRLPGHRQPRVVGQDRQWAAAGDGQRGRRRAPLLHARRPRLPAGAGVARRLVPLRLAPRLLWRLQVRWRRGLGGGRGHRGGLASTERQQWPLGCCSPPLPTPRLPCSYTSFTGCGGAGAWDLTHITFVSAIAAPQSLCLDGLRLLQGAGAGNAAAVRRALAL